MNTIARSQALAEMEIKESGKGLPRYFSISFYKKNGELVTLSRCRSVGLRANMTINRLRGVQSVDVQGNAIGHIYPVCIDNIRTFNHLKVLL